MSESPPFTPPLLQGVCKTIERISQRVQMHLSRLLSNGSTVSQVQTGSRIHIDNGPSLSSPSPPTNFTAIPNTGLTIQGNKAAPVSKEELGRATWTFLHTLGAQYPDKPTRQQRRDAKELMEILSRMYPCKDCADHFKEILRSNPVQAGSQAEFSQWLCHVHNVVNRSLGKISFQCERVDARWGKLECEQRACDLQGTTGFGDDVP